MQVRLSEGTSKKVKALADQERRSVSLMADILVNEALLQRGALSRGNDKDADSLDARQRLAHPSGTPLVQATVPEAGKVFRGPDPR